MKHCANILEILLIVALFFLYGAYAVPDVNEAHYLEKAAHFWNPSYGAGDFFLNSPDAHGVFYWSFGWLTQFFPMEQVVWIGRFLTWTGLACGWYWMTRPVLGKWGTALFSAAIFLFLNQRCSFAGEWVVGGVEAKGFAYVFAFFGLGEILRNHWNRALFLLGFSAMFHVLVGGWLLVALGIAWLILKDYELGLKRSGRPEDLEKRYLPTFASILPGLIGAVILILPALLPALALNRGVSPDTVRNATQLYVYERLPHHLLLSFIAQKTPEKLLAFGGLILFWNFLAARPRFSHGEMTFRTLIYATLFIALCGWGINLFVTIAPDFTASLLRYYWFRLADVILPLGASILSLELVLSGAPLWGWQKESWEKESKNGAFRSESAPSGRNLSREERKKARRKARLLERIQERRAARVRILFLACLVFMAGSLVFTSATRFTKPMKPRSCSGASCGQTWLELCQFVRENTEKTDVFVVPYTTRTFRWFTGRPEVGVWKDVPQDAQGLMDWWQRMQDQFYGFDPSKPVQAYGRTASFTLLPKQKFEYLKKEYGAKYLVRNKNDLKGRTIVVETPDGTADYELVYENKDFELRRLAQAEENERVGAEESAFSGD